MEVVSGFLSLFYGGWDNHLDYLLLQESLLPGEWIGCRTLHPCMPYVYSGAAGICPFPTRPLHACIVECWGTTMNRIAVLINSGFGIIVYFSPGQVTDGQERQATGVDRTRK